jgi:ssDNA thymidine ADP-ribosyltransferase, DarT
MSDLYSNLNPQKALIWRIVHRDNLNWLLDHGLHCFNSGTHAPNYVNIGNIELIDKRKLCPVRIPPMGYLADYIPFYFTPFSPMLLNIRSGYAGVQKRSNEEIIMLVSSLNHVRELGLPFVFTDAHAYARLSNYYKDLVDLKRIDWGILQRRDFKSDENDPNKKERYQAEALIYKHVPVHGLLGIVCYTEKIGVIIEQMLKDRNLKLPVHCRVDWYFK